MFLNTCPGFCERVRIATKVKGWIQKSDILGLKIVLVNCKTEVTLFLFVLHHIGATQQQTYGGITSLWIILTGHMLPYRTCCWTVSFFSSDGWSADRCTWQTCDCCSPGQQWLELQSDRPRAIDHGNTASVIERRRKQADITFQCFTAL